jgi:hypothetical protein
VLLNYEKNEFLDGVGIWVGIGVSLLGGFDLGRRNFYKRNCKKMYGAKFFLELKLGS